jgi:hydrogenase/urease accessory protein HupE
LACCVNAMKFPLSTARKHCQRLFHAACLLVLCSSPALPHDVDVTGVARMFLDEIAPGSYQLSVVDRQVPPLLDLESVIPARCTAAENRLNQLRFACDPGLNQADHLNLPWSLEGLVVIARWNDGSEGSAYFRGNGIAIEVALGDLRAGSANLANLAYTYLISGAEHILFGFDHLLFVFGLLLLLQGLWPLVKTITAFTVAHSITLGLAVLGVVNAPSAPVEIVIALSIVLLAREIIMGQRGDRSLVHRVPWLIAFIFGLFHGLGFAGALGELGLRASDIPLALLFFNLGVELGQLGFIALMLVINAMIGRQLQQWAPRLPTALAYGLGGISTYWFLERLPGLLPV